MNAPFEPRNDLEQALVAAQQNQMPVPAFVQTLLRSQVFVLVDQQIPPGATWHQSAAPMVLSNADKTPFLALFTAPERADVWTKRQTTFGFGLSTAFTGVLQGMALNLGIVINPGLPAGNTSRIAS